MYVEIPHTPLQIEKGAPRCEGTCLPKAGRGPGTWDRCPFWFGAAKLNNENLQRRNMPFDQLVRGRLEIMINRLHIHCMSRLKTNAASCVSAEEADSLHPGWRVRWMKLVMGLWIRAERARHRGRSLGPPPLHPLSAPHWSLDLFSML